MTQHNHRLLVVAMLIIALLYCITPALAIKPFATFPNVQNNNKNIIVKQNNIDISSGQSLTWLFTEFELDAAKDDLDQYDYFLTDLAIQALSSKGACLFYENVLVGKDLIISGKRYVYKGAILGIQNPTSALDCTQDAVADFYDSVKNSVKWSSLDVNVKWKGQTKYNGDTTGCTTCPRGTGEVCSRGSDCWSGVCTLPTEWEEDFPDEKFCWYTEALNSATTLQHNIVAMTAFVIAAIVVVGFW